MLIVWTIAALALIVAVAAGALAAHLRRARRRTESEFAGEYAPTSVDPRGRWSVSRVDTDLLEAAPYELNTDPDGPCWTPLPPVVRERPRPSAAPHPRGPAPRQTP